MKIAKVTVTFFCEEEMVAGLVNDLDWTLHEEASARVVFGTADVIPAKPGELSQSETEFLDFGGDAEVPGIRQSLL